MRNIKFRGKRLDNGEWVYGNYVFDGKHYITQPLSASHRLIEVDPATVGQFTGLPDKNGKEIYEGDVLGAGDRIINVKWNGPCGCWDTYLISYNGPRSSNGISASEWEFRAEVIGNIHDNPELSKKE
jgi:uncharacterized phage protein (TIGR01671 family)